MQQWHVARAALTDTSDATLVAAPGSTFQIVVHGMFGSNAGASLSTVDFREGATKKFTWSMAANGGGFAVPLPRPWELPANTALVVAQSAGVVSYAEVLYEVRPA